MHSIASDDESLGASGLTAIISDQAWQNYFDSEPEVIGRVIEVNGVPATIVGVAPPVFHGRVLAERADVWLPLLAFWQGVMPEAARAVDRSKHAAGGSHRAGSRPAEACRKRRPSSPRSRRGFGWRIPSIERHPV